MYATIFLLCKIRKADLGGPTIIKNLKEKAPVESDDFSLRVWVASLEQSSFYVLVRNAAVFLRRVALEVYL